MIDGAQPDVCAALAPSLSGLLDGELSWSERVAVGQHLRDCQACTDSLALAGAARQALRCLSRQPDTRAQWRSWVGAALMQAPPASRRRRWSIGLLGGVAAVIALLAIISTFWFAQRDQGHTLTDRAVSAQQTTTAKAPPLVPATADAEVAARWASTATGRAVDVPVLDHIGYHLLGVRAAPAIAGHAVVLVYAGTDSSNEGLLTCVIVPGHRALTGPAHGQAQIHLTNLRGTSVAGWWEEEATYLLVGDVAPDVLLTVALTASQ